MTFIMRMALREIRASWRRLLFFFVCIAIGVGSIVALRSVIQSVRVALAGEARTLLGADVAINTNRPWSDTVLETLEAEQRAGRVTLRSEAAEMPTMVRLEDPSRLATRMVELRAVGPEFPLYGVLALRDGAYTHALLAGHGAVVRSELLAQLGLEVGDRVLIGTQTFEIRGVITAEPGRRIGAFTLGPRVIIDRADLDSTGLVTFGTRARFQQLLRVPEAVVEDLVVELRETFANEFVSVRWYRRTEDQMGENLTRAENYLSLVGLVVLILGGIGVSSVTRVFVQQKVRSIAILKCLGTTSPQILAIYMTQVLLLGAAGSALGVALAAGVMAAVPSFVGDLTELMQIDFGLTATAVLQGFAIGLLVSILFSLVPLPRGSARQAVVAASAGCASVPWGRLAEVGRDGGRGGRARGGCGVAGWLPRDRVDALRRLRGDRVRFTDDGRRARPRRPAAPVLEVLRAAASRAAHRAARQSDARHPACRRLGGLLHSWRAHAAGEPASRLCDPGGT